MSLFGTLFIYLVVLVVIFVLLLVWPAPPEEEEPEEKQEEKVVESIEDPQQTRSAPEPEPEPQKEPEPQPEPEIEETEPEVAERDVAIEEFSEDELDENATEEDKETHEWNHNVRKITKTINTISDGNLKAINFRYVDRLINVRGKSRPIAFFLRPRSSELSPTGVFIYDTTRMAKNRALYLFVGPDADEFLVGLGEKLLQLMVEDTKCDNVIRIIRTLDSPEFNQMIHQMGGHKDMMQTGHNYGDQFFFEIQFTKTLLHINIFDGEMMTTTNDPDLDNLPENGAAVIDTSDNSLYLYVGHVDPLTEEEKQTQLNAMKWMNDQPEYQTRDILVFDKSRIPPNLALIFNK